MFDSFYGFFAAYIPLVILAIIGVWNEDKLIRIEQKIKNRTQNEPIHSGGGSIRRNQTGFPVLSNTSSIFALLIKCALCVPFLANLSTAFLSSSVKYTGLIAILIYLSFKIYLLYIFFFTLSIFRCYEIVGASLVSRVTWYTTV